MSNKVKINIALGDTKHPMIIDADDEPLYREAGRLVCSTLTHYNTEFRGAKLPPDYLMAFTAMDIAVRYLRQNADSNAEAAAQHLEETLKGIEAFMSPIGPISPISPISPIGPISPTGPIKKT